jgi:hypothetical protein
MLVHYVRQRQLNDILYLGVLYDRYHYVLCCSRFLLSIHLIKQKFNKNNFAAYYV